MRIDRSSCEATLQSTRRSRIGIDRAILLHDGVTNLPGATSVRVAAVCEPEANFPFENFPGVFYSKQPDTLLAVFNSPFGPDVLVATDRLSEGVDLHRFCRYLIHHELDPSPARIIQRNGRLRRINSWAANRAANSDFYPALKGTRDERLVEIVRYRLEQFNLLLGGVGGEVNPDANGADRVTPEEILKLARNKIKRFQLSIKR